MYLLEHRKIDIKKQEAIYSDYKDLWILILWELVPEQTNTLEPLLIFLEPIASLFFSTSEQLCQFFYPQYSRDEQSFKVVPLWD